MMAYYNEVQALANLFGTCTTAEEEESDWSEPNVEELNPGHIGPKYSKNARGGEEYEKKEEEKEEKEEDGPEIDLEKDAKLHGPVRISPEYEFVYRQTVPCSDVYIQLSERDCSSLSCEDLVMRIKLPGTDEINEINLDILKTSLKLDSPQYFLNMFLPHKVDKERSSAKWDSVTNTLIVTMPIIERDWLKQR